MEIRTAVDASRKTSRGGRRSYLKRFLNRRGIRSACGAEADCSAGVARLHRFAFLAFLLVTASSADAANPYPVPEGARSAALAYRPQWIEAAKRDPVFDNVDVGMDVDKVEVLDGFARIMIIGPDVIRFAESGKPDPSEFATRVLFSFPMTVEGAYVGSIVVRPRIATDPGTADFVFCGTTDSGGALDDLVNSVGGYAQARTFSVVSFIGESFSGVFLRLAVDDLVQFVPLSPDIVALFSTEGNAISLPADRAVPLIRARILGRTRE